MAEMESMEEVRQRRQATAFRCSGRHPPPSWSIEITVEFREDDPPPPPLWSVSKKKKIILLCLALGSLQSFMCLSLLAPFYPGEAQSRGISQFVSGWVFSAYAVTSFISAPFVGKEIPAMGAKFLYILGALVCGICTLLFGFLGMFPYEDSYWLFLIFSFLIRIVMALGGTAWFTSGFAIAMREFPENSATVMGLLETCVGVGCMVGPALGGVLYESGGFLMPFLVLGLLVLAGLPVYYCILETTRDAAGEAASLLPLLRIPSVLVMCVTILTGAILLMAIDPILELHLERQFSLNASYIGLVFLLYSGVYALVAPFVGSLADRMKDSSPLLLLGFTLLCVGFLVLGPTPLVDAQNYQQLWLNLVSMTVLGIASAFAIVPTYHRIMRSIALNGLDDSLATQGAMSGLWTSSYSLGEAVGPIVSGWMTDDLGFAWATTGLAVLAACMSLVLIVELMITQCRKHIRSASLKPDYDSALTFQMDNQSLRLL